jgi:hypothetical protein
MKKEITRSQLWALQPRQRMDLILGGECQVVNDKPAPRLRIPVGAMTRAQYDALPPMDRAAAARGRLIVNAEDYLS